MTALELTTNEYETALEALHDAIIHHADKEKIAELHEMADIRFHLRMLLEEEQMRHSILYQKFI